MVKRSVMVHTRNERLAEDLRLRIITEIVKEDMQMRQGLLFVPFEKQFRDYNTFN